MTQKFDDYRWSPGHDVALGSLAHVGTQLLPYNRKAIGSARRWVGIQSPPLSEFPVRDVALSGKPRGDGFVNTRWTLVLGVLAVAFVEDYLFSSGTVVSAPVTIYTRQHVRGTTYLRRNAYIELPDESNGTLEYLRQGVARVTYRFHNLTEPA